MSNVTRNTALPSNWFTFYTMVRPCLSGIATLALLIDFFQYSFVYFDFWWMVLYFFGGIAQFTLAIMTAVKSKNDYGDFVRFTKGVLLFETINIAYSTSVNQYLSNQVFGFAFVWFVFIFLAAFFLWYRLNVKYFEKRMLVETPPAPAMEAHIYNPFQTEAPSPAPNTKASFCRKCGQTLTSNSLFCSDCGTKIIIDTPKTNPPSTNEARFCRACGNNLPEGSTFCNKCGTKIN